MGLIFCYIIGIYCPASNRPSDGTFQIELVNLGLHPTFDNIPLNNTNDTIIDLMQSAALRWSELIVNDLPDVPANTVGDLWFGFFGPARASSVAVDDVLIGYEVVDLPGTFVGRGGARLVRRDGTTISGVIQLDREFLLYSSRETAYAVILHEMGHVLGIGSLWGFPHSNCDNRCMTDDTDRRVQYSCPAAQAAYRGLNLDPIEGTPTLQLEEFCRHWSPRSFDGLIWTELMIGYVDPTRAQLITEVSLASLTDVGAYIVDYSKADPIPVDTENSTNGDALNYGVSGTEFVDLELIEDVSTAEFLRL